MKVQIGNYAQKVLGLVLNSKFSADMPLSYKENLFGLFSGPRDIPKDVLNSLLGILAVLSDDGICWRADEETGNAFKLKSDGETRYYRPLSEHLEVALTLEKLPKLWMNE